jgi:hypothetical protein
MSMNSQVNMNNYTNKIDNDELIYTNIKKKKRPSNISISSSGSRDSYASHNDSVIFNRFRGVSMISTYLFLTIKKKITPNKKLNIRKKFRNFMERFSNDDD